MDPATAKQLNFAFDSRVSVAPAMKARHRHPSNLWIFESPKNNRRLILASDVEFMSCVLLEGEVDVVAYEMHPPPVMACVDGDWYQTELDAIVHFSDGRQEWWEFKRSEDASPSRTGRSRMQLAAQAQAASTHGKKFLVKTERDLKGKEILFDNWALLCAAMTRAKHHSSYLESKTFTDRLSLHGRITLGSILSEPECDPAVMLAVVARAFQAGVITANLEHQLIYLNTQLQRRAT